MKINASTIVRNNSNIHFQAKLNGKDSKQINMFQKTGHLSFRSNKDTFESKPKPIPKIEILPNVCNNFVSKITKQINSFSPEWLEKFNSEGYVILEMLCGRL